ncbi:MAG: DUF3817 domain-containing protein [Planctomycetota bacterium]|jgi:integral membrane protein|nr:DUF3817 domain-containing protein [Planctomycetota bacterium]
MSDFAWFRLIALIEGLSYLVLLLIAMPLKYLADMPLAVRWVGSAHGALFVAFMALLAWTWLRHRLPLSYAVWGFIASLVPGGTFVYDRMIRQAEERRRAIPAVA